MTPLGWIKGKKPKKSTETVAQLRKLINQYTVQTRALKTLSTEQRDLASQLVREGNKEGAKQALMRKKSYMDQLNKTHAKIANLRKTVDTIRAAEDNVTLTRVLQQADVTIRASLAEASPEKTETVMVNLEDSIDQVSMVEESLTSSSLTEIGLEDELDAIDDELAALEAEIASEAPPLKAKPVAPVHTPVAAVKTPVKEESASAGDAELEAEIAKMKKQLEQDLGQ